MAHSATGDIVSSFKLREGKYRNIQRAVELVAANFESVLDRHQIAACAVFSVLYFAWARLISNHKQLWFDELVSYSVDHLPTWNDAWRALQFGVDANPPLFHLVNRAILGIMGDTNFAQRASSIFGFWAMSLCVYTIVRRNHSAAASWVAALIPACSGAAYYATEARPYGMVLAFVSFAIICWLNAVEATSHRRLWLIGLTVSLGCAISSHYYAVFTIAPFIGAELTRAAKRKNVDWGILGAVMLSYLPLLIFYKAGLMTAANQYIAAKEPISLLGAVDFWNFTLGPVAASIAVAVAVAVGWNCLAGSSPAIDQGFTASRPSPFRANGTLLIAAWFCILPIVVALGARFVTHANEHRYAISALIGAAILLGAGFDALRSAVPGAAGLAILTLLVPVGATAVVGRDKPRGRHTEYSWSQSVQSRPELPIAYGMPLEFVQAWYHAPTPELKRRIVGLVNVKEGLKRTGSVTADLGVVNLMPALPVPALDYYRFIRGRQPFYLVYRPAVTSWVTGKLVEDGASLKLDGVFGPDELYLVTWPEAGGARP